MASKTSKSGNQDDSLQFKKSANLTFGKKGFLDLITDIANNGFAISKEFSVNKKNLLLRHDVDFDLECALNIAMLETEMGIYSHFFFLSSSPYYSLDSKEVRNRIERISELGHVIGLHYDASKERTESFETQKKFLEDSTGIPINIFSQHNPSLNGFDREISPELAVDVMNLNIEFKPIYMSDSNMRPRRNFNLAFQKEANIHLLLHPEYWILEISDFEDFEQSMMLRLPKDKIEQFSQHINLMKLTLRDRELLDLENRL